MSDFVFAVRYRWRVFLFLFAAIVWSALCFWNESTEWFDWHRSGAVLSLTSLVVILTDRLRERRRLLRTPHLRELRIRKSYDEFDEEPDDHDTDAILINQVDREDRLDLKIEMTSLFVGIFGAMIWAYGDLLLAGFSK